MIEWECLGCSCLSSSSVYCPDCTAEIETVREDAGLEAGRIHCPYCVYWADPYVRNGGTKVFWFCKNCETEWGAEELAEAIRLNEVLAIG